MNTNTTVIGVCVPSFNMQMNMSEAGYQAHIHNDVTDRFHSDYCPVMVDAEYGADPYAPEHQPLDIVDPCTEFDYGFEDVGF